MSNRELYLNNGWIGKDAAHERLYELGYCVAGYVVNGAPRYVLYRKDNGKYEQIKDFDTPEELNLMVKLLLPNDGG